MKELTVELKQGLLRVWETIAYDILAAVADGGDPEKATMTKAEVIEVVLDADYLQMYGQVPADQLKEWKALSYDRQIELAKTVFTYRTYGI